MRHKLEFVSYALREADSAVGSHRHDCYEIVYYMSGTGSTTINGTRYDYGPNQFTIIEPGCGHDENRQTATEVLFAGFRYNGTEILLTNGLNRDGVQHAIHYHLQQIRAELISRQKHYEAKLDLLLGELLIELDRLDPIGGQRGGDLAYAIRYLDENFNQPVDLTVLSELSGYSYHRFRHLFKQKTGRSPVNYLIERRLDRARVLLRQTDRPLAGIAQECGFYNESQLSMMFKRQFNVSPSRFRRS